MKYKTILFDLDGTLLDTAPDFHYVINLIKEDMQQEKIALEPFKPYVAYGSAAMLQFAFDISHEDELYEPLRNKFLQLYFENIARHTKPFTGIFDVLIQLHEKNISWGIVTNKPAWLTDPLISQIEFPLAPKCIISGDTLSVRKPHPDQLFHACDLLKIKTNEALFIGDALIDVQAAQKANMPILVAEYGYNGFDEDIYSWKATGYIKDPIDIIQWIER